MTQKDITDEDVQRELLDKMFDAIYESQGYVVHSCQATDMAQLCLKAVIDTLTKGDQ
ncbi:MAG: hypothetical protein ACXAEN_17515 [Candidatus Thorarchaeota archaeon]|jgi:hypothetical protein